MAKNRNLFYYLSGLGTLPDNACFHIELDDEFLVLNYVELKLIGKEKLIQQYKIKAGDILALDIVNTADLKKKSVVGRGAAGGLLFGPVGAVLGGMSATAQNKIKSTLSISYLSSGTGECKSVVFNASPPSWEAYNKSSVSKIKKGLEKIPRSQAVMQYLGQVENEDGSITL